MPKRGTHAPPGKRPGSDDPVPPCQRQRHIALRIAKARGAGTMDRARHTTGRMERIDGAMGPLVALLG